MNGKDIFLGLQYIGDDLIQEAEVAALSPVAAKSAPKKSSLKKPAATTRQPPGKAARKTVSVDRCTWAHWPYTAVSPGAPGAGSP